MTLKEQSAIIDRLQKENFDLKIKIYYLNDKLDKLSEEGVKELMQENADMKIKLAEALRERKKLNKRVKELEQEVEEAGKNAKSSGEDDDSAEVWELKETIEKYEIEIEKFREKERHREERMRELKRQANGARNNDEVVLLPQFVVSPLHLSYRSRKCYVNSWIARLSAGKPLTLRTDDYAMSCSVRETTRRLLALLIPLLIALTPNAIHPNPVTEVRPIDYAERTKSYGGKSRHRHRCLHPVIARRNDCIKRLKT
jgi:hypothetical protein